MTKLIAVPMSLKEANNFVFNFHRHNKPVVTHKFSIGASNGNELVGVAIVGIPVARLLMDGLTAEVLRTCTNDNAQKGTNSFLYGCCWRACKAMGYKRLVTYTLATESGASLRGAGWKIVAECKPRKPGPGVWGSANRLRKWQPIYGQLKFRWEAP
jgi:hypothetical protein